KKVVTFPYRSDQGNGDRKTGESGKPETSNYNNYAGRKDRYGDNKYCTNCNKEGHHIRNCYKLKVCYKCNKPGHIAAKCFAGNGGQSRHDNKHGRYGNRHANANTYSESRRTHAEN